MSERTLGIFYGVGVGPGDPELITRKAERILTEVDWIFLPHGRRSGTSFVGRILAPLGLPATKFRPVALCMSRNREPDRQAYQRAATIISEELRQGKSGAWVTEGDPLFYSTFLHLHQELRSTLPAVRVEIIPGITSASAAAARAGVPVACLGECVAVVPAAYGLAHLPALLNEFATIFLVKVHGVFDELLEVLACAPVPIQAVYVEQVGTSAERVVTQLESLRGHELPYFSLVLIRQKHSGWQDAAPG
jgi:precorrin-2/cobalt-factor-2 C20-methyltransferase